MPHIRTCFIIACFVSLVWLIAPIGVAAAGSRECVLGGGRWTPDTRGGTTGHCEPAGGGATGGGLINPLGTVTDIPTILGNVIRAGFGVLGSIALLMFIYGGFMWLTSGGVPERIKKGQDTMVWAVLGIAVAFTAYAIVSFVISAITKGA